MTLPISTDINEQKRKQIHAARIIKRGTPPSRRQQVSELLTSITNDSPEKFSIILLNLMADNFEINVYSDNANIFLRAAEDAKNDAIVKTLQTAGAVHLQNYTIQATQEPHPSKMDLAKQFAVMSEFMVSRADNIAGTKQAPQLKQMAALAKSTYQSFMACHSTAPSFEVLYDLYEGLYSLLTKFSKIYQEALANKKTMPSLLLPAATPISETIKSSLAIKIQMLDSMIKNMLGEMKRSLNPHPNLKVLLKNNLEIIGKLRQFAATPSTMNADKLAKRIQQLYKKAESNSTTFYSIINKKIPKPENVDDSKIKQHQSRTFLQENIKKLATILSTINNLESNIKSHQQTWLISQIKIKETLGKTSSDIETNILGLKELAEINQQLATSLEDLTQAVEFKLNSNSSSAFKSIIGNCEKYLSEHKEHPEKLTYFSKILTTTLEKTQASAEEIRKLQEDTAQHAMMSLMLQRTLERDNRASLRRKKSNGPKRQQRTTTPSLEADIELIPPSQEPIELKKNPLGMQALPLQEPSAFAISIPGTKTSEPALVSSNTSSSFFADSFNFSSRATTTFPNKPEQLMVDDLVVKKIVEHQIKSVLDDFILIDRQPDAKITVASMQEMLIKQNALLMTFCQFSESIRQEDFKLQPHLKNMSIINQARNCIYHNFSQIFSCSWPVNPEDLVDAKSKIALYKKVLGLLNALHESISHVNFIKLSENEFFQKLVTTFSDPLNVTTKDDAKPTHRYFDTICKAQPSLSLKVETQELANRFAVGAKDAAAKILRRCRTDHTTATMVRHQSMVFPRT